MLSVLCSIEMFYRKKALSVLKQTASHFLIFLLSKLVAGYNFYLEKRVADCSRSCTSKLLTPTKPVSLVDSPARRLLESLTYVRTE